MGCNEAQLRMESWGRQEVGERTDLEKEHQLPKIWGDQAPKGIWKREFNCKFQRTVTPAEIHIP